MAEAIYDFASCILKFLVFGVIFFISSQINKFAGPALSLWVTAPFGALALAATVDILRTSDRRLRQKLGYLPLEEND